jgi:hypothetical protein
MNEDRNTPNQAANKGKAEGERWTSEPDTVEQRDRSRTAERAPGTDDSGGITNRPLEEEMQNQDLVPERGESREGAHAGHGDRNRNNRIHEEE